MQLTWVPKKKSGSGIKWWLAMGRGGGLVLVHASFLRLVGLLQRGSSHCTIPCQGRGVIHLLAHVPTKPENTPRGGNVKHAQARVCREARAAIELCCGLAWDKESQNLRKEKHRAAGSADFPSYLQCFLAHFYALQTCDIGDQNFRISNRGSGRVLEVLKRVSLMGLGQTQGGSLETATCFSWQ